MHFSLFLRNFAFLQRQLRIPLFLLLPFVPHEQTVFPLFRET